MKRKVAGLLLMLPLLQAQAQEHAHHAHAATSTQAESQAEAPHTGHAAHHAAPPQQAAVAKSPAPALLPAPTAEERAAAFPDLHGMSMQEHMDDDPFIATLLFDRLEWQDADQGSEGMAWELSGWAGGQDGRLWLRSEGERRDGRLAHGDIEWLWGRPTGPWWDRVVGVRHELGHGPSRDWLAVGMQGLAPYKFEVSATAYLGAGGRTAARVEAEYELLLTNRLILQPRAEIALHGKDDPQRGVGRGISEAAMGLRLRYEWHRQFAPYLGYEWSRAFGRTADMAEALGEEPGEQRWVAGIRFWF